MKRYADDCLSLGKVLMESMDAAMVVHKGCEHLFGKGSACEKCCLLLSRLSMPLLPMVFEFNRQQLQYASIASIPKHL